MKINLEGVCRRDGEPLATVIFGSLVLPLMPPWCRANLTYLGLIRWVTFGPPHHLPVWKVHLGSVSKSLGLGESQGTLTFPTPRRLWDENLLLEWYVTVIIFLCNAPFILVLNSKLHLHPEISKLSSVGHY